MPILSYLIWLPVLGAVLVLLCNEQRANLARYIALLVMVVSLILCIPLYGHFDTGTASLQFSEHLNWIPSLKINYDLGIDGISLPLVILTCLTTLLIVLASWTMVHQKVSQYLATFLVMQGMMVGVFSAADSMLFYFFWEGTLIPMYLSIGDGVHRTGLTRPLNFFFILFLVPRYCWSPYCTCGFRQAVS